MSGFFKPRASSAVYQQEFSWLRAPEVWRAMIKVIFISFIAGAIFSMYAGCSDLAKDAKAKVPCKPVPTKTSPKS